MNGERHEEEGKDGRRNGAGVRKTAHIPTHTILVPVMRRAHLPWPRDRGAGCGSRTRPRPGHAAIADLDLKQALAELVQILHLHTLQCLLLGRLPDHLAGQERRRRTRSIMGDGIAPPPWSVPTPRVCAVESLGAHDGAALGASLTHSARGSVNTMLGPCERAPAHWYMSSSGGHAERRGMWWCDAREWLLSLSNYYYNFQRAVKSITTFLARQAPPRSSGRAEGSVR